MTEILQLANAYMQGLEKSVLSALQRNLQDRQHNMEFMNKMGKILDFSDHRFFTFSPNAGTTDFTNEITQKAKHSRKNTALTWSDILHKTISM